MKTLQLKEKDKKILGLIVETYLKVGKPVSSGRVVEKSPFSISSATVRNIMAKLEEFGFLFYSLIDLRKG